MITKHFDLSFKPDYHKTMRQSEFFINTLKEAPKDEVALNAKLLIRAGFIDKLMAGVYTFLPLGLKVLKKIENIVREEMGKIGALELLMPSLHPKENWERTGRWDSFDALFKVTSSFGSEYALGPTHEEIIYPLISKQTLSYKELPFALYQLQTKFRNEARSKSGILRGKEFIMKDLYSFHASDKDRDGYYIKVKTAYQDIFKKLNLKSIPTDASGGTFSENSLEFQILSPVGEDVIFYCEKCGFSKNKEIISGIENCQNCGGTLVEENAIEAGNIFPLKKKFAEDFGVFFTGKDGDKKLVSVGCYGFGITRTMGAIVETNNDEKGIIWPESVAPFKAHILSLGSDKKVKNEAEKIYKKFGDAGVEVLYDDRDEKSAGEKFSDADLIGIPWIVVVSEKTVKAGKIEVKKRSDKEAKLMTVEEFLDSVQNSKFKSQNYSSKLKTNF